MKPRIHIPALRSGDLDLAATVARHLRDVLRLEPGQSVEAFDGQGAIAGAEIISVNPQGVRVRVGEISRPPARHIHLTIAAAVPKGPRADWMIEKLSELGTDIFIPLAAERSVVLPEGSGKIQRWHRLAEQSARQSGRADLMRIEPLATLSAVLARPGSIWRLTLEPAAVPILDLLQNPPKDLTLLVGPEGGWSDPEIAALQNSSSLPARLTPTILRIETAAIAAAAIVESLCDGERIESSLTPGLVPTNIEMQRKKPS